MRLAFIHPKLSVKGGAENILVWLAGELARRGHEVDVFTTKFTPELWEKRILQGFPVHVIETPRSGKIFRSKRVAARRAAVQLAERLRRFDCVVGHLFPSYCWAAEARRLSGAGWKLVLLCEEPRRRLYLEVTDSHLLHWRAHTPPGVENPHLEGAARKLGRLHVFRRLRRALEARWDCASIKRCDLVLGNSAFTAANVRKIFGVPAFPCHLGVPVPPEPAYERGSYVGVLTSLSAKKNVHNTIRAAAVLVRRGLKDLRLRIGGRGRRREELERLASSLGIGGRVEFAGPVPDSELPAFYRQARLVVYCPIDEPFGLVPLEAMAQKSPIVVSDHGGPAEVVSSGVTGLHANPFDPESIAAGIQKLWTDEALARSLGEAGCREVHKRFSIAAFADRFEEALSEHLFGGKPLREAGQCAS